MNTTSGIRPFLGLALVMTGCGKAEIEYRHSSKAKVVVTSKSTEEGNHQRHEQSEVNQTTFRFAVEGRQPDEPQVTKPSETVAVPSIEATREPKQIMNIQTGAINIHVGDVHQHTYKNMTTIVHVPPQKVITQESISEPPRTKKAATPAKTERCERLRREHEARQAEWEKLFK